MVLDQFSGSTAKLMADPRLLEVPKDLKHLVDMCFHFPLNLAWFTCIPSGLLQMMTFSNIPMSSSHCLTFGMHLFWSAASHLLSLRKPKKKLMILCTGTPCLMDLEIFTKGWDSTWTLLGIQDLQRLRSILYMLILTRAILLWKIGVAQALFWMVI